jgi:hypothetical protein
MHRHYFKTDHSRFVSHHITKGDTFIGSRTPLPNAPSVWATRLDLTDLTLNVPTPEYFTVTHGMACVLISLYQSVGYFQRSSFLPVHSSRSTLTLIRFFLILSFWRCLVNSFLLGSYRFLCSFFMWSKFQYFLSSCSVPLPKYVFMAWYLFKPKDNFTFTLPLPFVSS